MDRARAMEEAMALSHETPVRPELADHRIIVDGIQTPPGWHPDAVPVRVDLPETYPEHQPQLSVPETLRYTDTRPSLMAPEAGGDHQEWCPVTLPISSDLWDPEKHSFVLLIQCLVAVMEQWPSDSQPG
jgi:hypothetical protein